MPPLLDWSALHGTAFRGRHCLVTGAAGFIGSHVADALVALGAQVRVLDDLSEGNRTNLPAGVELVEGSVTDPDACGRACDRIELVFHLAARVSVPRSVEDPRGYHDVNGTGTVNLIAAAEAGGVRRLVYSASSSAYGNAAELPKRETMPPLPMSPYAASKLVGEMYCRAYAECYRLDTVCLRYFNIFGPRQKANSAYAGVIAAFARDALAGKAPTIYGDGTASRDFTFVANAVHANLLAARHEQPLRGEVFNVGTGRRITVNELARTMLNLLDRHEMLPNYAPPRAGDVAHSQADISRSRQTLGFEPVVPFDDGLAATLAWYRSATNAG